jgi:hypothetical protein
MIITTSTEKEEEEKEVRKSYAFLPLHRSHPPTYLCRSSDVNYQQRKKGPSDQKS